MNDHATKSEILKDTLLNGYGLPANRRLFGPLHGMRTYRGKRQYVVGYNWNRPGAHFMTGLVYEAILGWGATFEDALAKAAKKVKQKAVLKPEATPTPSSSARSIPSA